MDYKSLRRAHLIISGRVQGIGFRYYTQGEATKLNLVGWVQNTDNGGVEIVAEGEEEALKKLIGWCKTGPFLAKVEKVKIEWLKPTGEFEDFSIKRYSDLAI